MTWSRAKLESLASEEPYALVGGPFGSKLTSRDYVEDGIPVIRGSNLTNGRFLGMDDFVYVTESKVRKDLSSNLAKPLDLIFTQRGTLGQVALVPEDGIADQYVVSQSQMKLTVDPAKADRLFLYYYFSGREAVERILSHTSSSGVPHINLTVLRNLDVPVPPISTQRKIAAVLSAYDDLIENNRRRIRLLEEAARLLYKEWFVHLRFPGHEHVPVVDGVPVGWERDKVKSKATVIRGRSYKSSELADTGGKPFVNLKCVARHGGFRLDGLKRFIGKHRDDQILLRGDVIMAVTDMTRQRHIVAHAARVPSAIGEEAAFSMDLVKLVPNDTVNHTWFYFFLRYSGFSQEVREHATGTNVLHLKPEQITRHRAIFPPRMLQEQFGEVSRHFLELQDALLLENERLAQARDLLLPKLMNGEIAA